MEGCAPAHPCGGRGTASGDLVPPPPLTHSLDDMATVGNTMDGGSPTGSSVTSKPQCQTYFPSSDSLRTTSNVGRAIAAAPPPSFRKARPAPAHRRRGALRGRLRPRPRASGLDLLPVASEREAKCGAGLALQAGGTRERDVAPVRSDAGGGRGPGRHGQRDSGLGRAARRELRTRFHPRAWVGALKSGRSIPAAAARAIGCSLAERKPITVCGASTAVGCSPPSHAVTTPASRRQDLCRRMASRREAIARPASASAPRPPEVRTRRPRRAG